jgi:hypothetical protein
MKDKGRHRGDMTNAHRDQRKGSPEDLTQKEVDIKKSYPDQAAEKTQQRLKDLLDKPYLDE